MTPIRPLLRDDLPHVASLYELVMRSGSRVAAPGLAEHLGRLLLDHPWVDAEIPSLVYESGRGEIVGLLGSHVRRGAFDGKPIRMACSGELVADSERGAPGVGALLLRRYLSGPQELTFTDGATDEVRALWETLGGSVNPLGSVGWMRVFRPAGLGLAARRRSGGLRAPLRAIARPFDSAARRSLVPVEPKGSHEALTPALMLEHADREVRVRPDYDESFLGWLFAEMEAVKARGRLRRRLVRGVDGAVRGWFVYYLQPGGLSEVQAVVGDVMDHLLWDAADGGSAAVRGRLEPSLISRVRGRGFWLRATEWQLVHSRDDQLRAAVALGDATLTRMEGEWWMGPHLESVGSPRVNRMS